MIQDHLLINKKHFLTESLKILNNIFNIKTCKNKRVYTLLTLFWTSEEKVRKLKDFS